MKNHTAYLTSLLVAGLLLITTAAAGQNTTNSPFTRYGYGRLEDGCFSRSQSMGDVAIALYSPLHINPVNPATYTSTDSTTFLFEVGISGLVSNFESAGARKTTFTGNLDYVAFQTPITKWLGASVGLIPFSYVGYNYSISDSIEMPGTSSPQRYEQAFQGSGGISQLYLGLTFNILDYVTFGANAYYMFGNLSHYRTMSYSVSSLNNYTNVYRQQEHISNWNVRFGLQYHQPIGRDHRLTLGAIYEFRTPMYGQYSQRMMGVDTIETEQPLRNYFEMPQTWGVGLSYEYRDRLTVAADFTMREFANAKFAGVRDTLANSIKAALGVEYIHNPVGRRYVERMWWRLGANYRNSYTRIMGVTTNDFSISLGLGFPLRTSKTIIHVNLEYGNIGSGRFARLKEDYFKFGVSFSLNETWFVKNKIR